MQTINPVEFRITFDNRILATYPDGRKTLWMTAKTERGAKACLTKYAKQYGMTVDGKTAK